MDSLSFHIAHLNSVLSRGNDNTPRACDFRGHSCSELARLEYDSVAQILSYHPVSFVPTLPGLFAQTIRHHTLAAVSPRMRLYAEASVLRSGTDTCFEGTQVSGNQLVYWVDLHGRVPNLTRLELSLWWSERCGLPIVLNAPNACRRLLTMLSVRWRQQVQRLQLFVRATSISDSKEAGEEHKEGDEYWEERERGRWAKGRQFSTNSQRTTTDTSSPVRLSSSTFLNALSSFSCLTRLAITGEYAADPARAAAAVIRALRIVHSLPVTEVELRLYKELKSLANLAGAPLLERLTVCRCGISDLHGLSSCPRLSFVDVSGNDLLTDISGLAGAARLTELVCVGNAVTCLDHFFSCPVLRRVDLSNNFNLSSLCGLADSPLLQVLNVSCTAVSDLSTLRSCRSLVEVDVRGCRNLRIFTPSTHFTVLADFPP